MPNITQDRVEEQFKRLPRRWLPSIFQSRASEEKRLAFLESIVREFKGTNDSRERRSLEIVLSEIRKIIRRTRPGRMAQRILNTFRGLGITKERFISSKEYVPAPRSSIDESRIKKLHQKHQHVIRQVERDLESRGFIGLLDPPILGNIYSEQKSLSIPGKAFGNDSVRYNLLYERSSDTGRYHLSRLEATLKREVKLERDNINGVDLPDLEKRMGEINWNINFLEKGAVASNDPEENKQIIAKAGGIFADLLKIMTGTDPEGKKIHDQLVYKYFSDGPNIQVASDIKSLKETYEVKVKMDIGHASSQRFSPREINNLLEGRAVEGHKTGSSNSPWYRIDFSQKDKDGVYIIKPIPGSEKMILEAALLKAGVQQIRDPYSDRNPQALLRHGEKVEATLILEGIEVKRIVVMDPENNSIKIDIAESEKHGLIPNKREEGQEKIQEYLEHYLRPRALPDSGRMASEKSPDFSGMTYPTIIRNNLKDSSGEEAEISPQKDDFDLDKALWQLGMRSGYDDENNSKAFKRS